MFEREIVRAVVITRLVAGSVRGLLKILTKILHPAIDSTIIAVTQSQRDGLLSNAHLRVTLKQVACRSKVYAATLSLITRRSLVRIQPPQLRQHRRPTSYGVFVSSAVYGSGSRPNIEGFP